jgi:hypothetical protein
VTLGAILLAILLATWLDNNWVRMVRIGRNQSVDVILRATILVAISDFSSDFGSDSKMVRQLGQNRSK